MSDPLLTLGEIHHAKLHPRRLRVAGFQIQRGQTWALIGGNGSGKTSFCDMLSGALTLPSGTRHDHGNRIATLSFEQEQALLEREIHEDESELIQKIDYGRTTRELIEEHALATVDLHKIIHDLQLSTILDRGFRQLSTGERRRMMIGRALSRQPDILILDEPFDGLDAEFTEHLKGVLETLHHHTTLLLVVNRLSQIGHYVTHLACLHEMELILAGPRSEVEHSPLWKQFHTFQQQQAPLPDTLPGHQAYIADPHKPIASLRNIHVAYHDQCILDGLSWDILPGQHWKISGPNGCGKSTLVKLISGDHPQCYSNDITLFGARRSQGESIWDIKRHMGLMSTTLHQEYRINVTAETVLLSGFFDSIGVYRPVSPTQKSIALQWLTYLGMERSIRTSFQQLSFGQQRLLLIARALIKRPHLLILDEPCQGLDPINRALVLQLIDRIAQNNLAQVLYISHEIEDRLSCLSHELRFQPNTNPPCPLSPRYLPVMNPLTISA